MVCFGLSWRRLLPVALACLLPLCGCNYHGRLKRGIYNTPSFDDKIEARVMVVADRFIQPYFSFKDDNLTPVNSYQIRTRDGASVAAADALGTLFSEVEVNLYKYRSQYDYAAELDYNVTEESDYFTRLEPADGFLWLKKYRVPKFHTSVTLTLRDTKTELPVLQFAADRTTELEFNNTAIGLYWFNRATLSLLFPLIAPVYTSSAGNSIRTTLERDLRSCLRKIMQQIEENRMLFRPGISPALSRNDARYRHLLEKTVFISLPSSHGSGFFISPDGYLLTNAHVVKDARDVRYYLYEDLPFDDSRPQLAPFRYARVIQVNKARDVALLKAEGTFPYFELDPDRSHYRTGDSVLVLGNPENEFFSVSEGIISALKNDNGVDTIQTDAAINHGNSGGPLVSRATGKVLGIASSGYKKALASGINFAITAYEVQRTLDISQPLDEEKLRRRTLEAQPSAAQNAEDMRQARKNYVK